MPERGKSISGQSQWIQSRFSERESFLPSEHSLPHWLISICGLLSTTAGATPGDLLLKGRQQNLHEKFIYWLIDFFFFFTVMDFPVEISALAPSYRGTRSFVFWTTHKNIQNCYLDPLRASRNAIKSSFTWANPGGLSVCLPPSFAGIT